jgi:dihydroflavonol-4-reductase
MKALVTGATGFIGANLIEAMAQRSWGARALRRQTSSLRALENLEYESAIGDINLPETLPAAMEGVDVVFHVAASADYWRSDKHKMMRVNVDGTRNVLQAALDAGVRRVVFTSSCASLGKPPFGQTLNESAQFNLLPDEFPYGYSKHKAEQVAQEFVQRGLDVVIVNPAVVLGPRDVNLISGSIIVEAAKRSLPAIPPGGVSFIDVADVCAGHLAAAERGKTGERYILTSENLWYRDVFAQLAAMTGKKAPAIALPGGAFRLASNVVDFARESLKMNLPLNGEQVRFSADTFWFDASKAKRELGLNPMPFIDAARRTYEWYKTNGFIQNEK